MKSSIQMSDHNIYISHAWGGESEEIVQEIYTRCRKAGLTITMDRNDLGYRESISSFMQNLGKADAIILVVSNKYLHSEYCMFELLQIYENKNILKRIFPVVLDEVSIAKSTERLELVKYWENETENLEAKIRELKNLSYIEGITDDLNLYQKIRNNIANLTRILKDINTLNIRLHKDNDYNHLITAIEKYIAEASSLRANANLHEKKVGEVGSDIERLSTEHPTTSAGQGSADKDKSSDDWWTKIFRVLPLLLLVGVVSIGLYLILRGDGKNIIADDHSSADFSAIDTPVNSENVAEVSIQKADVKEWDDEPKEQTRAGEEISDPGIRSKVETRNVQPIIEQKSPVKTGKKVLPSDKRKTDVAVPTKTEEPSAEIQTSIEPTHIDSDGPTQLVDEVKPSFRIEKVYVPSSSISVRFPQDISSNNVEEGDIVYLVTQSPIRYDDQLIAVSGARVKTRIIDARASHQGGRGALGLRLETLETIDGQWLDLNYHDVIERKRGEVIFKSGTVLEKVEIQPATLDLKIIN